MSRRPSLVPTITAMLPSPAASQRLFHTQLTAQKRPVAKQTKVRPPTAKLNT